MPSDSQVTIQELKQRMQEFVREREWAPFHSPKNLSMNLCREASELMEKFLWVSSQDSFKEVNDIRQEVEDEAADVLIALLAFVNAANIDLAKAFEHKFKQVAEKYPVEKSKGRSTKYTKL